MWGAWTRGEECRPVFSCSFVLLLLFLLRALACNLEVMLENVAMSGRLSFESRFRPPSHGYSIGFVAIGLL